MNRINMFPCIQLSMALIIQLFSFTALSASEVPQTFTLDGQLQQTGSDTALLDANAAITVQILDSTKNCILYEEKHFVNTTSSNGYFNIQVGSNVGDAKRSTNDPGRTMVQVFQNNVAIAANSTSGSSCPGNSYTPSTGASRYFRLIVTPSATNVADTLQPDTILDSVPNALVADSLQGYTPSSFLFANTSGSQVLNQSNLENIFSITNYTNLTNLLATPAAKYIQTSTNGGAGLPAIAGNPSAPAPGQIWFDSTGNVLKYYDGAIKTLGTSGGSVTSVATGTGLTGGPITTTGTINVDVGVTTGKIIQVAAADKLPVIDGSNLTNVAATSLSGNVSTQNIQIWDTTSAKKVTLTAPAIGSFPANYNLILPGSLPGTNGQALVSDTLGNLSFAPTMTTSLTNGSLWVGNGSNVATAVAPSNDVTMTNTGVFTVKKLQNIAISTTPPTIGTYLKYNSISTEWEPTAFATCAGPSQVMHYTALTDTWSCDTIDISTSTGTLPVANGGTGTTSLPGTFVLNGGQAGAVTLGPSDASSLSLNTSGSARMTILSGGNVGIGTTSPTDFVQIEKNQNLRTSLNVKNSDLGTAAQAAITGSADTAAFFLLANSSTTGGTTFNRSNGVSLYTNTTANGGLAILARDPAGYITLHTGGNTERIRIDSTGKLGLGTASPASTLDINGDLSSRGMAAPALSAAGTGKIYFDSTANKFKVSQNGGAYADLVSAGGGGGTVTDVTGSGAITSSGGNTPAISIADSAYGTKGAVSILTDAATSGLTIAAGVLNVNSGTAANQIVKLDGSAKLPAVDGSALTNLTAANISAGTLPIARGGTNSTTALTNGKVMVSTGGAIVEGMASNTASSANTFVMRDGSGNISAALGTFAGVNVSAGSNLTLNGSTSGSVVVASPAAPTSYTLTLPAGAGSSGQVLSTNGSGITSWVSALTSTTGFVNGGNSFGANATIGTNDNFDLDIKTNNTSKVTVKAAGNVGIGTTNPIQPLDVRGSAISIRTTNNASTISAGRLLGGSYTGNQMAMLYSYGDATSNQLMIGGGTSVGEPASSLRFYTGAVGTVATGSEKMRIEESGNVGVGTTSPASQMHVQGNLQLGTSGADSNRDLYLYSATAGQSIDLQTRTGYNALISNAAPYITSVTGANYAAIQTNGTERFRVDSNGNVGIGTTIPAYPLDVTGNINVNGTSASAIGNSSLGSPVALALRNITAAAIGGGPVMVYQGDSGNTTMSSIGSSWDAAANTNAALYFTTRTSGTISEKMRITSAGNVGIGTSTPTEKLDIVGNINFSGTGTGVIHRGNDSSPLDLYGGPTYSQGSKLSLYGENEAANPGRAVIAYGGATAGSLAQTNAYFQVFRRNSAGTQSVLLADMQGRVGIGTTAPSVKLHVDDAVGGYLRLSRTAVGGGSSPLGIVQFNSGATNMANVVSAEDGTTDSAYMRFETKVTAGILSERMRITSTGNVGIGTNLPAAKLDVNGAVKITGAVTTDSSFASAITLAANLGSPDAGDIRFGDGTGWKLNFSKASDNGVTKIMTLMDTGNVGIGNTAPAKLLHVGSASVGTGLAVANFQNVDGTCTITPAAAGSGIACSSDERLKENFLDVSGSFALDRILKLQAVTYNFKTASTETRRTGYKAQEIQKIAPEFVRQNDDGYFQVYYDGLIPWITEAIKTMNTRVTELFRASEAHSREIASVKAQADTEKAAKDKEIEKLKQENAAKTKELDVVKSRLDKIEKMLNSK